ESCSSTPVMVLMFDSHAASRRARSTTCTVCEGAPAGGRTDGFSSPASSVLSSLIFGFVIVDGLPHELVVELELLSQPRDRCALRVGRWARARAFVERDSHIL